MDYTSVEGYVRNNLEINKLNSYAQEEFKTFISMLVALREGEYFEYFNNFTLYLPLSKFPDYRLAIDLQPEELLRKCGEKKSNYLYEMLNTKLWDENSSELLKSQTLGEFYKTIDDTMKELNLYEGYKELKKNNVAKNKLELYASPVFFKLLDKGYKKYPDLIA